MEGLSGTTQQSGLGCSGGRVPYGEEVGDINDQISMRWQISVGQGLE